MLDPEGGTVVAAITLSVLLCSELLDYCVPEKIERFKLSFRF